MHFLSFAAAALLPTALCVAEPSFASDIQAKRQSYGSSGEYDTLGCPPGTKRRASSKQQLAALDDFAAKLFGQNDAAGAFGAYVARDLINHAPDVPGDGAALAQAAIGPLLASSFEQVLSTSVGQDKGTVFFAAGAEGQPAAIISLELFRFVGTCIVEHWIAVTPVNASSPNPKAYY